MYVTELYIQVHTTGYKDQYVHKYIVAIVKSVDTCHSEGRKDKIARKLYAFQRSLPWAPLEAATQTKSINVHLQPSPKT